MVPQDDSMDGFANKVQSTDTKGICDTDLLSNIVSNAGLISHSVDNVGNFVIEKTMDVQETHDTMNETLLNSDITKNNSSSDHDQSSDHILNAIGLVSNHSVPVKQCRFCGNGSHQRNMCEARSVICNFCNKKGHLRSVCERYLSLASGQHIVTSSVFNHNLAKTIVSIEINGEPFSALIDTGSTDSYIDLNVAQKFRFKKISKIRNITLAASNSVVQSTEAVTIPSLKIGDFVEVQTPGGEKGYEVIKIRYC